MDLTQLGTTRGEQNGDGKLKNNFYIGAHKTANINIGGNAELSPRNISVI